MAPKKKTVKDLASDMEAFESRFKEMEKVFNKLIAIESVDKDNIVIRVDGSQKQAELENKLKEMEKKLQEAHTRIEKLENSRDPNPKKDISNCNKCDLTFDKKDDLKVHNKTIHPRCLKCEFCDKTFEVKWKLETHLKTHEQSSKYQCDTCDKVFVLKWRLEQHKKTHVLTNVKFCHYFNNNKICPYDDIGCMFRHENSTKCKFVKCLNELCQFRHEQEDNSERVKFTCNKCDSIFTNKDDLIIHEHDDHIVTPVFRTDKDSAIVADDENLDNTEHENNDDDEYHPCDSCDIIYNDIEDLIDHYGETGHNT